MSHAERAGRALRISDKLRIDALVEDIQGDERWQGLEDAMVDHLYVLEFQRRLEREEAKRVELGNKRWCCCTPREGDVRYTVFVLAGKVARAKV